MNADRVRYTRRIAHDTPVAEAWTARLGNYALDFFVSKDQRDRNWRLWSLVTKDVGDRLRAAAMSDNKPAR